MSDSVRRLTDLHDWEFTSATIGQSLCRMSFSSPQGRKDGHLELVGISAMRTEMSGGQAVVSALEEIIINKANIEQMLKLFSTDAAACVGARALGKKLISVDFHVGMSVVCICDGFSIFIE